MTNIPDIKKKNVDFCPVCRRETECRLQKEPTKLFVKGKEYTFNLTVARCKDCGSRMDIPKLMDLNSKEIDEQYREKEGKNNG